jgi:hypothetical protein
MTTPLERPIDVYKIECTGCAGGCRYIVYNASVLGNPGDHQPDKWYFRPYPAPLPVGPDVGEPFDTAADAERAAREHHALSFCPPPALDRIEARSGPGPA